MSDDVDPTHHGGITVEIERCRDCANHQWCSNHQEARYEEYEEKTRSAILSKLAGGPDIKFEVNPGPKAMGMDVRESAHRAGFFQAMVRNPINGKYLPDVAFCYPRVGSFEVTVMRGGVRNNRTRAIVFSKLKAKRWPNPEWVAEKVVEVVNSRLGGFASDPQLPMSPNYNKVPKRSDEELVQTVIKKYYTLLSAFREYDENGDGLLSKSEFKKALQSVSFAPELQKAEINKLWQLSDGTSDVNLQTGEIVSKVSYRHFARKFGAFLPHHEHFIGLSPKSRGMSPSTRRGSGMNDTVLGSDGSSGGHKPTVSQMSRMKEIIEMPLDKCSPDMVRAKILSRCGSLTSAFRQFDTDGDRTINADEFERRMPKVLGVSKVPDRIIEELFDTFDRDMTGTIELKEFLSDDLVSEGHLMQKQFLLQFAQA